MKRVTLFTVGKLRELELIELEKEYIKRIKGFALDIIELKSYSLDLELEADEILTALKKLNGSSQIILLTEWGKEFTSVEFSKWFYSKLASSETNFVFMTGGAAGFSKRIKDIASGEISLSKLTFPHQFARVVFVEQLYRAETIKLGHPYHK